MNSKRILMLDLKKHWHQYEMFLILIALLEVLMMGYGLWHFDLSNIIRKIYFGCYIFLFTITIVVLTLNHIIMKRGKNLEFVVKSACVYFVILVFWTSIVSALDMNGGGYPVTYMTILAAINSLVALSPVLYVSVAILSSACMIGIALYLGNAMLHMSFYLNFSIFLLVAIAVEIRNYRSTREQYMLDEKLEEWAEIDALTRVLNRRALDNYLEEIKDQENRFSFVLIDADNFKIINDTYGHQEGDRCLTEIAGLLTGIFGAHVFRYGGDEFAVISYEDAKSAAEKIAKVNQALKEKKKEYVLQVCAGIYSNDRKEDLKKMFSYADQALYEAKQNGKGYAAIYGKNDCR